MKQKLASILNAFSDICFQNPQRFPALCVSENDGPICLRVLTLFNLVSQAIERFIYPNCARSEINIVHSQSVQFRAAESRCRCENDSGRIAVFPFLIQSRALLAWLGDFVGFRPGKLHPITALSLQGADAIRRRSYVAAGVLVAGLCLCFAYGAVQDGAQTTKNQ